MHMPMFHFLRITASASLLAAATLLAGCSSELASFDDTYVPASVEENFPITVVERPVKLTVKATAGGIPSGQVNEVIRFGKTAAATASTPVTVGYPSRSKSARQAANQAAGLLVQQGVARQSIIISPVAGSGHAVTLAFAAKVAETKPCGDWSENLRANQFNESGTAFGCAVQQNFAAMVTNPEDFETPRSQTPAQSAAQNPALQRYNNGTWTTPTSDSSF